MSLDGDIENFHGGFANQLRVRFEIFWINNVVVEIELEGICESDAIHFKLESDIEGNISKGPAFKPVNSMPTHMSP